MAPKYKLHAVSYDGRHTLEYPATDDVLRLIAYAEQCGQKGFTAVVYVLQDPVQL